MAAGKIKVGLSGWSYKEWRGDFYPKGLPHRQELAYATEQFPTLEINGTFYSLSTPKTMRSWYETAPKGFVYAVKGSRFITHNKKLGDIDEPLANFMASGILELREQLGPILWQIGKNLRFDRERMDRFLAALPRTHDGIAEIAAKATLDRPQTRERPGGNHRVRHVIEPRHESFFVEEMTTLARRHRVALAFSHSSAWPYTEEVTARFVYLRLHGPRKVYASSYRKDELEEWADKIRAWSGRGLDVYVYFDNDSGGHAPKDATALMDLLDRG